MQSFTAEEFNNMKNIPEWKGMKSLEEMGNESFLNNLLELVRETECLVFKLPTDHLKVYWHFTAFLFYELL